MKKTLKVNIYKNGENNGLILDCIGSYNEGKSDFSPRDLEGYLNIKKAYLPALGKGFTLIKGDSPNEYHISEDGGKSFTMSLEWCETWELQPEKEIEEFLPNNINA